MDKRNLPDLLAHLKATCSRTRAGIKLRPSPLRKPRGRHGGPGFRYCGKTGKVDAELGRQLNRALQQRNEAHYRPGARLMKEDAREVTHLAHALLALLAPHRGTPNISTERL